MDSSIKIFWILFICDVNSVVKKKKTSITCMGKESSKQKKKTQKVLSGLLRFLGILIGFDTETEHWKGNPLL